MKSREPLRAQGLPCSATSHFARHQLAVRDGIDEGLVDYIEIMSTRRESGASAASRATYAGVCKPRSQLCLNTARHAYSTLSTSSHEEEKEDGSATGEEKVRYGLHGAETGFLTSSGACDVFRVRVADAGPGANGSGTKTGGAGRAERRRCRGGRRDFGGCIRGVG